jgi:CRP-like cAMP-binding protein
MAYPHSFIKLTRAEEKKIWDEMQICLKAGKYRRHKRLKAIWLSSKRFTFDQIAETSDVSYRTVKRWVSKYRKERLITQG